MTPLEKRAIRELDDLLEDLERHVHSTMGRADNIPTTAVERTEKDFDKARDIVCAIRDSMN